MPKLSNEEMSLVMQHTKAMKKFDTKMKITIVISVASAFALLFATKSVLLFFAAIITLFLFAKYMADKRIDAAVELVGLAYKHIPKTDPIGKAFMFLGEGCHEFAETVVDDKAKKEYHYIGQWLIAEGILDIRYRR